MKKQILLLALMATLSVAGHCAEQPVQVNEKSMREALEHSRAIRLAQSELKKMSDANSEAYKAKEQEIQGLASGFDMTSHVLAAIEILKSDPGSEAGFTAMQLIPLEFFAVRSEDAPSPDGRFTWPEYRAILKQQVDLALEYHIDNNHLIDVISMPLRIGAGVDNYAESQSYWKVVLEQSPHKEVRGVAAYRLADQAIDFSVAESVPEHVRREASMDVARYSKLALGEYAEVMTGRGKTIKEILEGKLFAADKLIPGNELPNVQASNLLGEIDQLVNYRGKVVLMDFWATWCVPCKMALPKIATLKEELAGKPFEVISISVDDEVEDVLNYQESELPMPWVNWHIGPDSPILSQWGVQGFPTYYLVDAKGVIRDNSYFDENMKIKIKELVDEME